MISIDALLFDLDGTLVDSRTAIVDAVNHALNAVGIAERSAHEITAYIGGGVDTLLRRSLGLENEHLLAQTVIPFNRHFAESSTATTVLYQHAREVLEHFIKAGKQLFVVTNRRRAVAEKTLTDFNIREYFTDVIGADEVHCAKPAACPIKKVLNRYELAPTKTIMIGDMDVDVLAGKGAGVVTCGALYGIGKKDDILQAHPDLVINQIAELTDIII